MEAGALELLGGWEAAGVGMVPFTTALQMANADKR